MLTTILVMAIFILCGVIAYLYMMMNLYKESYRELDDLYKDNTERIKRLLKNNHETLQLAKLCVLERQNFSNAISYASHYLKPRKAAEMWRLSKGVGSEAFQKLLEEVKGDNTEN